MTEELYNNQEILPERPKLGSVYKFIHHAIPGKRAPPVEKKRDSSDRFIQMYLYFFFSKSLFFNFYFSYLIQFYIYTIYTNKKMLIAAQYDITTSSYKQFGYLEILG